MEWRYTGGRDYSISTVLPLLLQDNSSRHGLVCEGGGGDKNTGRGPIEQQKERIQEEEQKTEKKKFLLLLCIHFLRTWNSSFYRFFLCLHRNSIRFLIFFISFYSIAFVCLFVPMSTKRQKTMTSITMNEDATTCINTVRVLAGDITTNAKSGHPGMQRNE